MRKGTNKYKENGKRKMSAERLPKNKKVVSLALDKNVLGVNNMR